MTTKEIRKRAKKLGLKVESDSKTELVRAIQAAEGNPQCFATGRSSCEQTQCAWLEDCVPAQFAELHGVGGVGAQTGFWRR